MSKYTPVPIPKDLAKPATRLSFHAGCISAARESNAGGICRDCWDMAQSVLPPARKLPNPAALNLIAVCNPDGSTDMGVAVDDGGLFDDESEA